MYTQTPKKAFYTHKAGAKKRKIEFKFTFEEWATWWKNNLGKDWFKKRGNKKGKYVMARKKDTGAYEVGNVKCITHSQNLSDTTKNGTSSAGVGRKLTTKQVKEIYLAKGTQTEIGRKYGVDQSVISDIKNKRWWKTITINL